MPTGSAYRGVPRLFKRFEVLLHVDLASGYWQVAVDPDRERRLLSPTRAFLSGSNALWSLQCTGYPAD